MQLRLSRTNKLIRFAYPFGYRYNHVSLCRLFWQCVFNFATCLVILGLIAGYGWLWYTKTLDTAIITGGVIGFITFVVVITCFEEIFGRGASGRAADRIADSISSVVDSTPAQLIYAGYKGIKERFCPIIVIAEKDEVGEDVHM